MVKIDTSVWNNKERLRKRVVDLAKMILILAAVNSFEAFSNQSWFLFSINIINALIVLPIFFSKAKFEKEPPKQGK